MKIYNTVIKKKTLPLVLSLALSTGILSAGCSTQAATIATDILVGENQRLVQGQIVAIAGNELTLAILELASTTEPSGDNTRPSRQAGEVGSRPSGTPGQPPADAPDVAEGESPSDRPTRGNQTAPAGTLQLNIPVGTKILTAEGKTTTFSRLAAGDTVQVLLEQSSDGEVIVGIWMVEITETEQTSDATANY
jgi:hypothetical protein